MGQLESMIEVFRRCVENDHDQEITPHGCSVLLAELERMQQESLKLRAALEKVEWTLTYDPAYEICPWCGVEKVFTKTSVEHHPNCQRQLALGIAPGIDTNKRACA